MTAGKDKKFISLLYLKLSANKISGNLKVQEIVSISRNMRNFLLFEPGKLLPEI